MSEANVTPINCIYGEGNPTGLFTAPEGTRYIDSLTSAEYEFSGGGWNGLGGGGAGGLPYTSYTSGLYTYWYVNSLYALEILSPYAGNYAKFGSTYNVIKSDGDAQVVSTSGN